MNSDNTIYPILIFKPRFGPNCYLEFVSQCLADGKYNSNDIERLKLDKNGNALIFCKKYEIMTLIMSDEKIFSRAKKIILNQSPSLFLKGLKFEDANDILKNPIKLRFGRMVFTEHFMSNIIQCNNCKIF